MNDADVQKAAVLGIHPHMSENLPLWVQSPPLAGGEVRTFPERGRGCLFSRG